MPVTQRLFDVLVEHGDDICVAVVARIGGRLDRTVTDLIEPDLTVDDAIHWAAMLLALGQLGDAKSVFAAAVDAALAHESQSLVA